MPSIMFFRCNVRHAVALVIYFTFYLLISLHFSFHLSTFREYSDKKERYFHIYYDDGKKTAERENFETKIDRMAKKLKECMGEPIRPGGEYSLDYAITATQKAILNAFDMTAENIQKQAREICSDLARITQETLEKKMAETGTQEVM